MKAGPSILVVRLGAMGDIIHALPAVASLKHSYPGSVLTWAVEPKWQPLLQGNPFIDRILPFERWSLRGMRAAWHTLRERRYDIAVDFQGLIKSALVAMAARPDRLFGFHPRLIREGIAASVYSNRTNSAAPHVVDQNLDLALAAGATSLLHTFALPPGVPEGVLPAKEFVLASPLAGWAGKQWPLENYSELGRRLREHCGLTLVLNAPQRIDVPHTFAHVSGIPGLIDATRKATAVVGLDSGPLHLAAALGKPGVALYGPTDPARNGPYGGTFRTLRQAQSPTTHRRTTVPDRSMQSISVDDVFQALSEVLPSRVNTDARH